MSQPAATMHSSKKRRFQPRITNYFSSSTTTTGNTSECDEHDSSTSYDNYSLPTHSVTPILAPDILSGLLGVGARVRKSVAEGYKTEQSLAHQKKLNEYPYPTTSLPENSSGGRCYAELEPFCGIHKIGNYAVQTFPRPLEEYDANDGRTVVNDEKDEFSIPSSSQESMASQSSNMSNKRPLAMVHSDDEDEENEATTPGSDGVALPSHRPIYTRARQQQHRRVFRSSRIGKPAALSMQSVPQASGPDTTAMDMDEDFGEATFLRSREEVDF